MVGYWTRAASLRFCRSIELSNCAADGHLLFRTGLMSDSGRIALFIDGANLYGTTKALGFDIDYKRLLEEFQRRGALVRAYYYTAVVEDQEFVSIRPLVDWLDY